MEENAKYGSGPRAAREAMDLSPRKSELSTDGSRLSDSEIESLRKGAKDAVKIFNELRAMEATE